MEDMDLYLKKHDEVLYHYDIDDHVRELARKYGFLEYMVERYLNIFGSDAEIFMKSCSAQLKRSLRCNTLRTDCKKLEDRMNERGFKLSKVSWTRYGYVVENIPVRPTLGSTLEYMKGYYYIQGLASMIPPEVLSPSEDDLVLDMAASPGGKTSHLAQLMGNRGVIVALEKNTARLRRLNSNLARLGVANTITVPIPGDYVSSIGIKFDSVLLDSPCSGEGLLPVDPSRRTKTLPQHLREFQRVQLSLLIAGIRSLRKGGKLVYSTCSIAPEENEVIVNFAVEKFGLRTEEIRGIPADPGLVEYKGVRFSEDIKKCIRLYPHKHGTEGFFVCSMRKE